MDEFLSAATKSRDKRQLADALAESGISAAGVHDAREVAEDQSLRHRGHMVQVIHPEAGSHWQSGLPAIFSRTPGGVTAAAPLQGQHSWSVFSRLLGMEESEYQRLCDAEVTGRGAVAGSSVANQA